MSFYKRIVWDMETVKVVEIDTSSYQGPAHLFKGSQSKQVEQAATAQQQQQTELMRNALTQQQGQLDLANPVIKSILANGGLSPETEASLRSTAMNTLPNTYNNLYGNLNNLLVQRGITGGSNAGSGDIARNFGAIGSQEAGQQSQLLSQIPLLKEQGQYQALNAALGVGNTYSQNVGLFNQGSLGALNTQANAAQSADAASTGFWGSLFGGLAGLGTKAIPQKTF